MRILSPSLVVMAFAGIPSLVSAADAPDPCTAMVPTDYATYTLSPTGVLQTKDLEEMGAKVLCFQTGSQPDVSGLAGRDFVIELPSSSSYDKGSGTLTFTIATSNWSQSILFDSMTYQTVNGLTLLHQRDFVKSEEGTSRFGGTITTNWYQNSLIGIANFSKSGTSGLGPPWPPGYEGDHYTFSVKVDPDKAAELGRSTVLVAKGRTTPPSPDRAVTCGEFVIVPMATDIDQGHACVIPADITDLALVDRSDGDVLKEWK